MDSKERRFSGKLSDDYALIQLAYPDYERLQAALATRLKEYSPLHDRSPLQVIELGCGDGYTTKVLLESRHDLNVYALDHEPKMIRQARDLLAGQESDGRLELIACDVIDYLRDLEDETVDVIASGFTLHNFLSTFRSEVLKECYRVLRKGGLFLNADKYAPSGQARFDAWKVQVKRFFDAFVPIGEYELLQEWILHQIDDHSPDRVMMEEQATAEMTQLGFSDLSVTDRTNMEALLTARKP